MDRWANSPSRGRRAGSGWGRLVFWATAIDAALFAAIGIRHVDREAIAFAVLFVAGIALLRLGRRGILGLILIGLLAADTEFWMVTATVSNLQNGEALIAVLQPLVLAIVTAAVLAGVIASLLRRSRPSLDGLPAIAAVAVVVFGLGLGGQALLAGNALQPRTGSLQLFIQNTAYSTRTLSAGSGQVSISVSNQDLFWHTFTIDGLGVNVAVPVGGHRQISFNAPPGTYTFYCAIPGHRQAGMQGTITVG
ncbi:MAG TPA: cupredoxin domain-containing protein [Candidatus Dormibacteraeota bacterium]|nr:cupredoxin domain-containing protein [Candidatus Dormibacteraeota bacterium]